MKESLVEKLFEAVRLSEVETVKALIEAGADVDTEDNYRRTALIRAAEWGHVEVVKALIEAGADVDAYDLRGWTALMWAAWKGDVEVVKALIEADADVDAEDKERYTAQAWAEKNRCDDVVKFLKSYVYSQKEDEELLEEVIKEIKSADEILDTLFQEDLPEWEERPYDDYIYEYFGDIELMIEALKDEEVKKELAKKLEDLEQRYEDICEEAEELRQKDLEILREEKEVDDFIEALEDGDVEVVESFLQKGWDVNDSYSETDSNYDQKPLMWALNKGSVDMNIGCVDIVKMLIAAGADVDAKDYKGETALMYASWAGLVEIIELLLDAGADVDAISKDGETALDIAKDRNKKEIIEILEQHVNKGK